MAILFPNSKLTVKLAQFGKFFHNWRTSENAYRHGKKYLSGFVISKSASVTFEKKFLGRISRKVLVQ